MPQVSLYLNDSAFGVLKKSVAQEKRSVSSFVSELIMNHEEKASWPTGYWADVYGSLSDESFRVPDDIEESFDGPLPSFS